MSIRNNRNFKYIHLLWHNELKFNSRIIAMVNDDSAGFDSEEHLFVTPFQEIYDALKEYGNVVLDDTYGSRKAAGYVNRYAPKCHWLFLHSMCQPLEALKIKKAYWRKIVHRTWGGDLSYCMTNSTGIKKLIKGIINIPFTRRMRKVRLIGVADTVDILNVQEKIGNVPTHVMPYPVKDSHKILSEAMASPRKTDGKLNIMIGHSGYDINNHKGILDALYRFKDENIQIYIPLSYGIDSYIEEVKAYGEGLYGDKITIIEEMLPYDRYVKLVNEMDIAFFDGTISYALGNIQMFKLFRKKLFLHKDGIIRKAFDFDGMPYVCSSELENMSFKELSEPIEYSEEAIKKLVPISYENRIETWHNILKLLDS